MAWHLPHTVQLSRTLLQRQQIPLVQHLCPALSSALTLLLSLEKSVAGSI